jgi:hypothetical protein
MLVSKVFKTENDIKRSIIGSLKVRIDPKSYIFVSFFESENFSK